MWEDGATEFKKGEDTFYDENKFSTKAGKYYGGHKPCKKGDNYPICGVWKGMSVEMVVEEQLYVIFTDIVINNRN